MIYRFTIISDEVDDFMREVKIDSDASFIELHKLILESCGYEDNQLTFFTVCHDGWEKGQEITLERMDTDSDSDSYVMSETRLSEFLEDEKQHLLYTFDPLSERCFFIELSEIITGKSAGKGQVTRSVGEAPSQTLDFDDMFSGVSSSVSSGDFGGDLFSDDDGISDEDIDLEGLDITDGEPF